VDSIKDVNRIMEGDNVSIVVGDLHDKFESETFSSVNFNIYPMAMNRGYERYLAKDFLRKFVSEKRSLNDFDEELKKYEKEHGRSLLLVLENIVWEERKSLGLSNDLLDKIKSKYDRVNLGLRNIGLMYAEVLIKNLSSMPPPKIADRLGLYSLKQNKKGLMLISFLLILFILFKILGI